MEGMTVEIRKGNFQQFKTRQDSQYSTSPAGNYVFKKSVNRNLKFYQILLRKPTKMAIVVVVGGKKLELETE